MKIKGNVLFPIEGTAIQQHLLIVILVLFSFVIPCHLICYKINVRFLRGKTNLLRTLIHSRFLRETSKENPGAKGSGVLFSLGGIFTAESVLQSSMLLEVLSFR